MNGKNAGTSSEGVPKNCPLLFKPFHETSVQERKASTSCANGNKFSLKSFGQHTEVLLLAPNSGRRNARGTDRKASIFFGGSVAKQVGGAETGGCMIGLLICA